MDSNKNFTILIVDDIPENIQVLKSLLSLKGYIVKGVTDGQSALKAAKVLMPDVILLDIKMPGMDGFEVCTRLKEDPKLKDIPVIFITALADTDSKLRAFELGGSDYVTKPFQDLEVFARVKSQLQVSKYTNMLKSDNISLMEKVSKIDNEKLKAMALLDAAFEQSQIGMGFMDRDGKILSINNYFASLLGYEEIDSFIGLSPFDFTQNDTPSKKEELLRKLQDDSVSTFSIELQYHKKEGNEIWLNIFISKISNPATNEISYIMIAKDISSEKESQRLLEQRQAEIESLINITMEGILVFEKGKCIDGNDASVSLFGYKDKSELLGSTIYDFVKSKYNEQIKQIIDPSYTSSKEINMLKKDGSSFIALVKSVEININQTVKTIVTVVDLSKSKKKDQILYQQSKMAAMGEMIGNIAHQWRQPLNVISTGATGLKMDKEYGTLSDDFFIQTCDAINNNAQYLSRTIDDFRDFIKGDRKKVEFNISNDINSFLHLVEGAIKNNDIHIIKDIKDDIEVCGYPNELIQCFINIFNNAKDALKDIDGEKYIFISTQTKDEKVIITFRDNAGGIPSEILPKIFEPYFTTKHKSQGTGLGLSMIYNLIVEGMDGTIEANSVVYNYEGNSYKGAEFKLALPLN